MNRIMVLVLVVGLMTFVTACGSSNPAPAVETSQPAAAPAAAALTPGDAYICSMHPEVTSGTAGKCPKCGMDLITMADYHQQHPESTATMPGGQMAMPATAH